MARDKPACKFCKSGHGWKYGKIISKQGMKQRYICNICGKTFYLEGGENA
ncbi:MAG: hypothetical protein PHP18_05630 [Bacilli bacterium]|nr:hypothetical protein [Bacilli bacterium]